MDFTNVTPDKVLELKEAELCELDENLSFQLEEIDATKKVIREELAKRMKNEGEVYGDFQVSKAQRLVWAEVKIEQAKEFGAVKDAVDSPKLTKLYKAGAKLPFEPKVTEYLMIKRLPQGE